MTTVSTSAFYERSNAQIAMLRKQSEKYQSQIGSGQRLGSSSDDPVGAARLRMLGRQESLTAVDKTNSDRAEINLTLSDQAISDMTGLVVRAKELAIQAANGTISAQQQASIGGELASIRDGLIALANSRDAGGNALFGGLTGGQAYQAAGSGAVYVGTGSVPTTNLGAGQSVIEGVPGPDLFDFNHNGAGTNLFNLLGTLADAMSTGGGAATLAASDALSGIDTGLDKLTTSQTVVGTRLAWIDTVAERRIKRTELDSNEQYKVGGADLATSISKLQQTMTVLEASQASFVKLANLSLFDILR